MNNLTLSQGLHYRLDGTEKSVYAKPTQRNFTEQASEIAPMIKGMEMAPISTV